jgi:hypothetical protein
MNEVEKWFQLKRKGKRIGSSAMGHTFTAVEHFHVLWGSINKKKGYGWEINPWCWAISFEVQ